MKTHVEPSPLIRSNVEWLKSLHKCARSSRHVSTHIEKATDEELLCLVEICLNLLKGRLPVHGKRIARLGKQAELLRRLTRTRSAPKARRLLRPQTGDGLPAVAGLLASILIPIIVESINN